jgi:hypothetical protein
MKILQNSHNNPTIQKETVLPFCFCFIQDSLIDIEQKPLSSILLKTAKTKKLIGFQYKIQFLKFVGKLKTKRFFGLSISFQIYRSVSSLFLFKSQNLNEKRLSSLSHDFFIFLIFSKFDFKGELCYGPVLEANVKIGHLFQTCNIRPVFSK